MDAVGSEYADGDVPEIVFHRCMEHHEMIFGAGIVGEIIGKLLEHTVDRDIIGEALLFEVFSLGRRAHSAIAGVPVGVFNPFYNAIIHIRGLENAQEIGGEVIHAARREVNARGIERSAPLGDEFGLIAFVMAHEAEAPLLGEDLGKDLGIAPLGEEPIGIARSRRARRP